MSRTNHLEFDYFLRNIKKRNFSQRRNMNYINRFLNLSAFHENDCFKLRTSYRNKIVPTLTITQYDYVY